MNFYKGMIADRVISNVWGSHIKFMILLCILLQDAISGSGGFHPDLYNSPVPTPFTSTAECEHV